MVKPYPIFFEPIFKERIWGGTSLHSKFGYHIPNHRTGEAWVIADHPNGSTKVRNGELAGHTLHQVWEEHRELFGHNLLEKFPLLVKLIDANANLSVQVHPDDQYAAVHENGEYGKTEAWLVLHADPGAKIIYGHRAKTREEFVQAVEQGNWQELLVEIPVQTGDFYFVPSGTLHALGEGIIVLEIQQNSDTTYRVYDYDRTDKQGNKRELHLDKAFDVVSFPSEYEKMGPAREHIGKNEVTRFVTCPYFTIQDWIIRDRFTGKTTDHTFLLMSVVRGHGKLRFRDGEVQITKGEHFLIPAALGEYQFDGELELVVASV